MLQSHDQPKFHNKLSILEMIFKQLKMRRNPNFSNNS